MIDEKWLFNYIDALPEDSPSRIALVNMYVAWRKEQESYICGVTNLPCCFCNACCEHRRKAEET